MEEAMKTLRGGKMTQNYELNWTVIKGVKGLDWKYYRLYNYNPGKN